jgi:nucleoid-associated protein EbfC
MNENMLQMMGKLQRFQEDMGKMQADLKEQTVETSAGEGAVIVTANGQQQITSVVISPEAMTADNTVQVQEWLVIAVNGALRKAQEVAKAEMEKLTHGMGLPNIPGLF